MTKRAAFILTAAIGAAGAIAGLALGTLLLPGQTTARSNEAAYRLSDFTLTWPHVDAARVTRTDEAVVGWTTDWAADTYPGKVSCEVVLLGSDGLEVGTLPVRVSLAEPGPAPSQPVPVTVTGEPSRVVSSCGPSTYAPGEGYSVGDAVSIAQAVHPVTSLPLEVTKLTFVGTWVGENHPGVRRCEVTAQFADGRRETFGPVHLSLGVSPFTFDYHIPVADAASLLTASMSCAELDS